MQARVGSGWQKLFVFLGREKLVEYSANRTWFFHSDHLGTPRVKTNLSGGVEETWDSYPFGEAWGATATPDQHRYTGHLRDYESENDYAGARYYASLHARWLSVDPVRGSAANPQSLNRYSYVMNDPVNYIDPDGREPTPVGPETEIWVFGEISSRPRPMSGGPGSGTAMEIELGPSEGFEAGEPARSAGLDCRMVLDRFVRDYWNAPWLSAEDRLHLAPAFAALQTALENYNSISVITGWRAEQRIAVHNLFRWGRPQASTITVGMTIYISLDAIRKEAEMIRVGPLVVFVGALVHELVHVGFNIQGNRSGLKVDRNFNETLAKNLEQRFRLWAVSPRLRGSVCLP